MTSVTNTNRGIGNAAVSVNVPYKEDTDRVGEVLKEIAAELRHDPDFSPLIRGDLALWGVDKVDGGVVTIVGQLECTDAGRWAVQREFNRRMKKRFQGLGMEIAVPTSLMMVQPPAPNRDGAPVAFAATKSRRAESPAHAAPGDPRVYATPLQGVAGPAKEKPRPVSEGAGASRWDARRTDGPTGQG